MMYDLSGNCGDYMNYVAVYWSRFGHNKQIVDYIDEKLSAKGHEVTVLKTDEVDPSSLPDAEMYIFSASAEAFRLQKNMRKFMKKLNGLKGKKYVIINTHGMKKRNWLKSMDKLLSKKGMEKVAETDFIIGEGQDKGEGFTEDWKKKLDDMIESL
jgi:flavodoxin